MKLHTRFAILAGLLGLLLLAGVATLAPAGMDPARAGAAGAPLQGTPTPTPACAPAWTVVAAPPANSLFGVAAVGPADIWATGPAGYLHWDGTQWSALPGASGFTYSLAAVAANDVWAVGYTSGSHLTLAEHWNGSQWSVVPSPNVGTESYFEAVAAVASNDVWAAGYSVIYSGGIGYSSTLVEHWNGSAWSVVASGNPSTHQNHIYALSATSANDVWAAGDYLSLINARIEPLIGHWNGSNWLMGAAAVPTGGSELYGVTGVAANNAWAVGFTSNGNQQTLVEHWDGSTWTIVPSPNVGSYDELRAVTTGASGDLWAVGYNYSAGGSDVTLVEHWDGASWTVVPSPNYGSANNELYSVVALGTADVWAVGGAYVGASYQALTEHYTPDCATVSPTPLPICTVSTATPYPTATAYPTITPCPWCGPCPVAPTNTPYPTSTAYCWPLCATNTPTSTPTNTPTSTPTNTPTATPTFSSLCAPLTATPNPTYTPRPTPTYAPPPPTHTPCPTPPTYAPLPSYTPNPTYTPTLGPSPTADLTTASPSPTAPPQPTNTCVPGGTLSCGTTTCGSDAYNYDFDVYLYCGPANLTIDLSFEVAPTLGGPWTVYDDQTIPVYIDPPGGTTVTGTLTETNIPAQYAYYQFVVTGPWWFQQHSCTEGPLALCRAGSPTPPATASPPSHTPTPSPTGTPSAPTRTALATATPCAVSFSDVHPTDYFYQPVQYLACRGVISGYADGTFRPYNPTTRAQMVKIVVFGFGRPLITPPPGQYTFADVPPTQPFFTYIETAAAGQIVSGYACGGPGEPCDAQHRPYFRPNASVTRGQLSKIVVAAAGWALQNPASATFTDVPPGSAFYEFVETAACHGIVSGYTCGGPGEPCDSQNRPYFRQYANATRGQIAKIVYGALTGNTSCSPGP